MSNGLLTAADVAAFIDHGDASSARMQAAADAAHGHVFTYLGFDPAETFAETSPRRVAAKNVAVRIAARLFANPLETSSSAIDAMTSSSSFNSLVGPRLMTSDEREQLDRIKAYWRRRRGRGSLRTMRVGLPPRR